MRERYVFSKEKQRVVRVADNRLQKRAQEAMDHAVAEHNRASHSDHEIIEARAIDGERHNHIIGQIRKANGTGHRISGAEYEEALHSRSLGRDAEDSVIR